jgi:hypothetical protein
MTFFDILKDLFFTRKSNTNPEVNTDTLQMFTPYIVNRWYSFSGKEETIIANETFNKYSSLFDDKHEMYKFYYHLIPSSRFKRISYVKKKKEEAVKEDKDIEIIAKNKMISQRELKMYMAFLPKSDN